MKYNKLKIPYLFLCIIHLGCQTFKASPLVSNSNKQSFSEITLCYMITVKANPKYNLQEKELIRKAISELQFHALHETSSMTSCSNLLNITAIRTNEISKFSDIVWLTGLSIGLIPTYTSPIAVYDYNYEFYTNNALIKSKKYRFTVSSFNWLFSCPFVYGPKGNNYREKVEIKKMTRDFFNEIDLSKLERKVPVTAP